MNKNFYCFQVLAWMIICLCAPAKRSVALAGEPLREVNTISDKEVRMNLMVLFPSASEMKGTVTALDPPEFSPEPVNPYPDETDIAFNIDNPNADSNTEIYRSVSETSGFALIATVPGTQETFFDRDLKPRTMYYYRLRAVRGEEVSDFSNTGIFRTNSKNYPPELIATAVDENTIELTLHDRSYNDIGYTIRLTSPDNSYGEEVSFPTDSGGTLVLIHEPVNSGTHYVYQVDMQTMDEGSPVLSGVTSASVTTPLAPPEFSPEPVYYEENNVAFIVDNDNAGGYTEIYRSLSETTGFELVATIPYDQEEAFFDTNLNRHSDYYYRLRATWNGQASAFSETGKFHSWAKNYPPTLTARAIDENTIELTLKDNSYNDIYYTIRGTGFVEDGIQFESDSGATRVFIHEPVNPATTYSYSVDVTTFGDGSPEHRNVAQATVTTPAGSSSGTGSIKWEVWTNEVGTEISSVDYYKSPDHTTSFTIFESSRYYGNNYGSRMSGYVSPPVTGSYTFWIASDDRGELWLSTDEDPIKKVKIASVSGYAPYRNWNKYPAQQSAPVTLEAGRRYYIEALHKENNGDDYVSVGWQLPDGTLERPIPGNRLTPFGNPENTVPAIIMHEPVEGQEYTEPAEVFIFTTPSPQDSGIPISKVIFYRDTTILYEDTTSPFQYSWHPATEGTYTITAKVVDEAGGSNMAHATIKVNPPSCSDRTGVYIAREIWTNIPGTSVSSIPVDTDYDALQGLYGFETQTYYANNYGSRIRAQVCVPVTGNYVFWIASDDNSELWLSTSDDPYSKVRIASVTGATKVREWTKYATQQSAPIPLKAGYKYYIEALHKEANGNDHVEVGWQLPDGTLERPIPASRLIEYSEYNENAAMAAASAVTADSGEESRGLELYPNPASHEVALAISGDGHSGLNGAQVQVIAATGEVVHAETVKCADNCTNTMLRLPDHVNPGVYMVNVIMGRKRLSKKLMVK